MARTDRRFRVRFADGTTETVMADSLDEAWAKARRSARKQISTKRQGRKVVADVKVEPGQITPPREYGKVTSPRSMAGDNPLRNARGEEYRRRHGME